MTTTSDEVRGIGKVCQATYPGAMTTMNISLPENLKEFVDERVEADGYSSASEYVRMLIRRERDRAHVRALLLEGAASPLSEPITPAYFDGLREHVRAAIEARGQ